MTLARVVSAGKPRLPAWGSGTSLVEYLGEVVGALQRQCRTAATVAALRQDLLQEIGLTKLGPAVETDGMGARSSPDPLHRKVLNLNHLLLLCPFVLMGQEYDTHHKIFQGKRFLSHQHESVILSVVRSALSH